jgi:hypothetical protein
MLDDGLTEVFVEALTNGYGSFLTEKVIRHLKAFVPTTCSQWCRSGPRPSIHLRLQNILIDALIAQWFEEVPVERTLSCSRWSAE